MKKISLITATLISLHSATFTQNITNLSFSPNNNGYANSNSVSINWTPPTITGSTLDGYYYKIDTTSNTIVGVGDTTISSSAQSLQTILNDSSSGYYFHIASYAQDGDIAGTMHLGPIKVDATTPSVSFSPDGGSSNFNAVTIVLTASESGAIIYYTLDGTTPTTSSSEYSSPLSLGVSKSIKVLVKDLAGNQSSVTTKNFTINTPLKFQSLTNSGAVAQISTYGATAYTTLSLSGNGVVSRYQYKIDNGNYQTVNTLSPIDISTLSEGSHSITLLAGDTTNWQSENEAYNVNFSIDNTRPTVTATNLFTQSTNSVTINTNLSDVDKIYYTIDGTTPTTSSTLYSSAITLTANTTIKAIVVDKAGNQSTVVESSFTYTSSTPTSGGGGGGFSSPTTSSESIDISDTIVSIPSNATSIVENYKQIITTETKTLEDGTITNSTTTISQDGSLISNIEFLLNGAKIITTIEAPNGTNIVIDEDGTIKKSLNLEDTKSEIIANQNGEVEITLTTIDDKTSTFKVSKGSNVILNKDGTVTAQNEVTTVVGKLKIKIEAKPTGELIGTSTTQNGDSYEIIVPNNAKDKNIEVIDSALKAIFKVYEVNSFSLANRNLRGVTIDGESIGIKPISSWQKYEQNQYFDGNRSIKLLLGQASLLVDGEEVEMEKGVEYLLPPTTIPLIENLSGSEVFIDNKLKLKKGWNLLSSPINEPINDISIFGNFSDIYIYDEIWKQNPEKIDKGYGFWINMNEENQIEFNGETYIPNLNNLTIWKLLGTGKDLSNINATTLTFQDGGWLKNQAIIYRGQGFWVKENEIKINSGWNLVSNPKLDEINSTVFESVEEIYAFRDNIWEKNPTTIKPLEGVWIKSNSYQGFDLESISSSDFSYIPNNNSWQLLGTPININSIKVYNETKCDQVWAYNGGSWYQIENSEDIKGGAGFWVK